MWLRKFVFRAAVVVDVVVVAVCIFRLFHFDGFGFVMIKWMNDVR